MRPSASCFLWRACHSSPGAGSQVGRYRNTGDALTTIVRTEGVRALFRGIGPSVAAIIPEAAITYGARPPRMLRASGTLAACMLKTTNQGQAAWRLVGPCPACMNCCNYRNCCKYRAAL